jgi:hypothetical protein
VCTIAFCFSHFAITMNLESHGKNMGDALRPKQTETKALMVIGSLMPRGDKEKVPAIAIVVISSLYPILVERWICGGEMGHRPH